MPITSSAKKAHRVSLRKRAFNDARKEAMRGAIKVAKTSTGKEAAASVSQAFQAIDKAAKRGVISKASAARKKSGLSRMLAKTARA